MMTHIKDLPKPINGVITLGEGCVIESSVGKVTALCRFIDATHHHMSEAEEKECQDFIKKHNIVLY